MISFRIYQKPMNGFRENADTFQFLHIGFNVDRIKPLSWGISSERFRQLAGNRLKNDFIQIMLSHQISVGGHVCGFI